MKAKNLTPGQAEPCPPFVIPIRNHGTPLSPEAARRFEQSRIAFLASQPQDHGFIGDPEVENLQAQVSQLKREVDALKLARVNCLVQPAKPAAPPALVRFGPCEPLKP